jgi:CheY-like chemotaxis protein
VFWKTALIDKVGGEVRVVPRETALTEIATDDSEGADVFVISADLAERNGGLRLLSDLRSRPATRNAATLMVLPEDDTERAAIALDLGASDILYAPVDTQELAIRIRAQLRPQAAGGQAARQPAGGPGTGRDRQPDGPAQPALRPLPTRTDDGRPRPGRRRDDAGPRSFQGRQRHERPRRGGRGPAPPCGASAGRDASRRSRGASGRRGVPRRHRRYRFRRRPGLRRASAPPHRGHALRPGRWRRTDRRDDVRRHGPVGRACHGNARNRPSRGRTRRSTAPSRWGATVSPSPRARPPPDRPRFSGRRRRAPAARAA